MRKLDKFYIGGHWSSPNSPNTLTVLNPATHAPCLEMACADAVDCDKAIAAARSALPSWAATPVAKRAEYLNALADGIEARRDDLCDALTMTLGIPRHQAYHFQLAPPIEGLRFYAGLGDHVDKTERIDNILITQEPVGVCVLIDPWNYPLFQLIGKVAPALMAGCTMVAKPAEQTPLCDVIFAEIADEAGLPAGVFNMITGIGADIGPVLSSHPDVDMVSFTGSTRAGISVAQSAAPGIKRVCQELGGKSAFIITEDAPLDEAVPYGVDNVMMMAGQTCDALSRMLVPASLYDRVAELAVQAAEAHTVGDPFDPQTTIGPMSSQAQKSRVIAHIKTGSEEGAELLTGGAERPGGLTKPFSDGAFVQPTIFGAVTPDMTIAREEIFGPVLSIMTYDDLDEAITIANDSEYGLSSAVWAGTAEQATQIAKRLEAGQCFIQGGSFSVKAPFGGFKQSGNGREWGVKGLEEYLETKAIIDGS